RKAVLEMTRFLDDAGKTARVALSANHLRLDTDSLRFVTKLIDGRFPDYEKVIPKALSIDLRVNRREFHDVLNRAAILTNEKFRGVRLSLSKNQMTVTAHNPEQEEAVDQIEVDYDGAELEIGFNVGYLMEALRVLNTDEVEVGLQDSNSSCTLEAPEGGDTLYLVMPMRL
ncbi:MAG: DNA polymerase III subunit beta, partial [Gammaproteobacteria bacterium]|nr:DNA polymerase III subunit beta [Gammaproteobacteria bacterium]